MTWHQVSSLFGSHPSPQTLACQCSYWRELAREESRTPVGSGQWLAQALGCPRVQHRGWHIQAAIQKTSAVDCHVLPHTRHASKACGVFSGSHFRVCSHGGYCQLKPEFSSGVLLLETSHSGLVPWIFLDLCAASKFSHPSISPWEIYAWKHGEIL